MNKCDFQRKKETGSKISMLTCYDYPSARIIAESGVDCALVGDSVAMVVHGHGTTVMATMEMMVMHTEAVARGLNDQFLVSDLPFLSYRSSIETTINNVKKLLQAGAHAVKLEGGDESICQTVTHLTTSGVPVMGHIGLTPQSVLQMGGYKVQGREESHAELLIQQAVALEAAGCFAIVLECVPQPLAKKISQTLRIPTIGIGAGPDTDGQVLVWQDMLGLQTTLKPRFVKHFLQGKELIQTAIHQYTQEVQQGHFPSAEYAYT